MRSLLLASLIAVTPACLVGGGDITGNDPGGGGNTGGGNTGGGDTGGGDTGGGTTNNGKVEVTVDQDTVATQLGKTVTLTYTIASQNGYAGTVTVTPSVTNNGGTAVPDWTLTADQPSVTLAANAMATVVVTAKIPTDDMELAPVVKLAISDGTTTAQVASNFTVANTLIIDLPAVGTGVHTDWPAKNAPIKIRAGATVTFHNSDTIPHEIHSGGGIPHEGGALNPGMDYTKTNVTDDATWYCHIHGGDSSLSRLISVE